MLTRLYVNNYKALVNFELALPQTSLLLGGNGSGKSSVFEAIDLLRQWVRGAALRLRSDTLTRWQTLEVQTFELEAQLDEHAYRYTVEVAHQPGFELGGVQSEQLIVNGDKPLFKSGPGGNQLFYENGTVVSWLNVNPGMSPLKYLAEPVRNQQLTRFVNWLSQDVLVCRINPVAMRSVSKRDTATLETDLSNFASWWRHLHDEDAEAAGALREAVAESLPGFRGLEFRKVSDKQKQLRARFGDKSYGFKELSDGQRALIALYALLVAARSRRLSLFLDEPDNFVSIREIQPFYNALSASDSVQATLISHHPTLTNLMAVDSGFLFRRSANAPVRVEKWSAPADTPLTASELIAMGYFDEPA